MDTELIHGAYFLPFEAMTFLCAHSIYTLFATHLFNVKYISSFNIAFLLNIFVYTFRRFLPILRKIFNLFLI